MIRNGFHMIFPHMYVMCIDHSLPTCLFVFLSLLLFTFLFSNSPTFMPGLCESPCHCLQEGGQPTSLHITEETVS